jgi:hypothetical protein
VITGSYPCCGGDLWIGVPEVTPKVLPEDCPHCGVKVWHVLSRLEPLTYLDADFRELYDVDDANKRITRKLQQEPV